jgi:hypothetical protein
MQFRLRHDYYVHFTPALPPGEYRIGVFTPTLLGLLGQSDVFDVTTPLVGPAGPTGPMGPIGPLGPMGVPGATGATRATGATGATGPTGPAGTFSTAGVKTIVGSFTAATGVGSSSLTIGCTTGVAVAGGASLPSLNNLVTLSAAPEPPGFNRFISPDATYGAPTRWVITAINNSASDQRVQGYVVCSP